MINSVICRMKRVRRILSFVLVMVLAFGAINVNAQSLSSTVPNAEKMAKEIYENLDEEAKEVFLNYLNQRALNGDSDLLEFHMNKIDKNYKAKTKLSAEEIMTVNNVYMAADAGSLSQQLAALNLPLAVEYGLLGFAGSLSVPVGNIIDLVVGLGLVAIIVYYWDDIADVWDDIIDIFVDEFGSMVKSAFRFLESEAKSDEVDVSDERNWTEVDGKVSGQGKGRDGTIKKKVVDKDTGEVIGEIHMKQPEKVNVGGGKEKYTGRKFPTHYHDYANLLGKGSSHHYWWK